MLPNKYNLILTCLACIISMHILNYMYVIDWQGQLEMVPFFVTFFDRDILGKKYLIPTARFGQVWLAFNVEFFSDGSDGSHGHSYNRSVLVFWPNCIKYHFSREGINVQQREITLPLFNIKYMWEKGHSIVFCWRLTMKESALSITTLSWHQRRLL